MIKLWFAALGLGSQIAIEAGILTMLGVGVWYVHHSIYQKGYDACQTAQIKAVQEGEKRYEKLSVETGRLSDVSRRNALCHFMRDADLPTCLKTLAPIRQ